MAVTHVGSDSGQGGAGNTNDITLTLPTHQADDYGIAICTYRGVMTADFSTATAGWTLLEENTTTSGADIYSGVYVKKFTSSSETNPVFTIDVGRNRSVCVHVFRGVDTTTAQDVTQVFNSGTNDSTPTNSAITPVTANGALLLFGCLSHSEITTYGLPTTPSSLSTGEDGTGFIQELFTAYKVDYGSASTITPTAWTHSTSGTVSEWHVYSFALRPVVAAAAVTPTLMMMGVGT